MKSFGNLSICADDFALTDAVSRGILDLAALNKLSAISCMTAVPLWKTYAPSLGQFARQVDRGLHLVFSDFFFGDGVHTVVAFSDYLKLYHIGKQCEFDRKKLAAHISRQLDLFEEKIGQPPDFIDGHQHFHHFPGIRTILIEVLCKHFQKVKPWVRFCASDTVSHALGQTKICQRFPLIAATGAYGLREQLLRHGFSFNASFWGRYAVASQAHASRIFTTIRSINPEGALVYVHPCQTVDSETPESAQRMDQYLTLKAFSW